MNYSPAHTVSTVARREMAVAARSKSIMISLALLLVASVVGILAIAHFAEGSDDPTRLVVTGAPAQAFTAPGLEAREEPDAGAARTQVRGGEADAALVLADGRAELLSDGTPAPAVLSMVSSALDQAATAQALGSLGIDPAAFAQARAVPELTVTDVSAGGGLDETDVSAVVTVMVGVIAMMFLVLLFAGNIGGRVTEEKSSRVVEIVLASVRPIDFLAGKMVGNVVFGLGGTVLVLLVAGATLALSGLLEGVDFSWSVLPLLALSYLLALLFIGSLYAAAGSLVSRAEDLSATQLPILMVSLAMIYAPSIGWTALDSTLMRVLTWLPPTSLTVAPLQFAAGHLSLLEVLAAFGLAALATLGVLWLVARIYRNAILHNGRRVSWLTAVRG